MIAVQRWCRGLCIVAVFAVLTVPGVGWGAENGGSLFSSPSQFLGTVQEDYEHLYLSPGRLLPLGVAFGVGAVVANTNMDRSIQDWYQQRIRTDDGDRVSKVVKEYGNGLYVVPISVAAAILGDRFSADGETSPIGTWGQRATRAYLAGGSLLLVSQWVTGGSRPTEDDSHWRPFHDNNGVSGHAFIGAVPFLTAGRMCEDNPFARYLLYAASALPALSRVNDNAHYPSQAFLGWFLAWEATSAVMETDRSDRHVSVAPMIIGDTYGLALCIPW
jgi:hypothetical protein